MSGQHDSEFEAVAHRSAAHSHAGHDHGPRDRVHDDPTIQRMAIMGLPAGAPNSVVARAVVQRQEEEGLQMRRDPGLTIQRQEEEEELQMRRDPGLTIQRQEEEEELQMRRDPGLTIQRQEEEEELQMRRDPGLTIQRQEEEEEELQMRRDPGLTIQRQEEEEELQMRRDPGLTIQRDEEEELQMLDGGGESPQEQVIDHASMVQRATSGGGQPLDDGIRPQLEEHVGQDLSGVKVHTGAEASEAATSLGAEAFTVGEDIVFGPGKYDPASDSGAHRIAHEAQHIVQQRSGPVSATETGTGVAVSDPSDAFEVEAESLAANFKRR